MLNWTMLSLIKIKKTIKLQNLDLCLFRYNTYMCVYMYIYRCVHAKAKTQTCGIMLSMVI